MTFYDDETQADNRDPLDAMDQDFDWQQLYERLSEDVKAKGNDRDLAETVSRLLRILVPYREGHIYAKSLGFRLIALAWVLDPGYFPGSPSLRELAQRAKVTPAKLARYTGHYSQLLRWRNRGQRHAWNWSKGQRSRFGKNARKSAPGRARASGSEKAKGKQRLRS